MYKEDPEGNKLTSLPGIQEMLKVFGGGPENLCDVSF